MDKEQAIESVKPFLSEGRFAHTLRVADTAEKMANQYQADADNIVIAAIFHDYAKERPLDELERVIRSSHLPKDLLHFHHELWHGPAASILIEREYGITNPNIKQAIYYHTTGKAGMSLSEMILFVADYIEPGRDIPGIDTVRSTAEKSLIKATWQTIQRNIQFLTGKNSTVYPDTFHAYNYFTNLINGGFS